MLAAKAQLLDGTPLATAEALARLREHALRVYPREALGYVSSTGAYKPLANLSAQPEGSALPDPRVIAQLLARDELRAVCHSHPGGPDCPSEADMLAQVEMEVPFVIISTNGQAVSQPFAWGDQLLDDGDLVGRPFRHGVQDCYALIRLWYRRERGIELPEVPRNWEWWLDGTPGDKDLYRRYFAEAGFRRIEPGEARADDCWIAAVRSAVPNHAGVYLGNGLALHHASSGLPYDPGRLSKRDSIARWTSFITHWVRWGA